MQRYGLIVVACLVSPIFVAYAEPPKVTPESQAAAAFWAEHVQDKPANTILGERQIIPMTLFSGHSGLKISPRTAAIADLIEYVGSTASLRYSLREAMFTQRAAELLGRPLDETQAKAVADVYKKMEREYSRRPETPIIVGTYGLACVVNFHETLKRADSIEAAFERTARYHGWLCNLRKASDVPIETIRESIDRGLPLLFEKDGTLHVCFGYVVVNGTPHLLLNDPAQTSVVSGPPYITSNERESIDPFVIAHWRGRIERSRKDKGGSAQDIRAVPSLKLPTAGFLIEPYNAAGWTVWLADNYRYTAAAWDRELRSALNIKEPPPRPAMPKTGRRDEDLWNQYFLAKPEKIGGPHGLVATTVLPTGRLTDVRAAMFSVALSQKGPRLAEFAFSPARLYRWACDSQGELFLAMNDDRLAQLNALHAKLLEQHEEDQRSIRAETERIPNALVAAALRLNVAVNLANTMENRLAANLGNQSDTDRMNHREPQTLDAMLANLERNNGWTATLERAEAASFAVYKKAIHAGVPVIVQDAKTGAWKLAVGYLDVANARPMLLIADPALLFGMNPITIDRDRLFPERGVYFEEFVEGRYNACVLHNWRLSAEPYAKELQAIFPPETETK